MSGSTSVRIRRYNTTGNEYDAERKHGCSASGQERWERKAQQGLPTVTIPIP